MSKNNLLNEGTIRRFMKLANVETLAENFVERLAESTEPVEEMMGHHAQKAPPGKRHGEDEPVDEMTCSGARDDEAEPAAARDYMEEGEHEDKEELDVDVAEVPAEDDAPVGAGAASVEDLARALLDTIQDLVPGLVTVEDEDEEAALDVDAPADDVEDMMETTDETLEEETVEEAAHDKEKRETMEETIDEVNVVEDDDLINEVAKRVTARLVKSLAARKKN
jgi:hypothetical protein